MNDMQALLRLTLILFPLTACSDDAREHVAPVSSETLAFDRVTPEKLERAEHAVPLGPEPPVAASIVPNHCEDFTVVENSRGQLRYRRNRRSWTRADQRGFRRLVGMVASEMGAEPRLFQLWSLRESSHRPTAIHVLNPDLEGAVKAWERHLYRPDRALELGEMMRNYGAKRREYWQAKAELDRRQTFRQNPHYLEELEFDFLGAHGDRQRRRASRWSFGYGPFGFNPTYFVPVWDQTAPPWVFCSEGGIVAIVTAVWAAREHQAECRSQGMGESYSVVNRRFSSGHCRPRPGREAMFARRARIQGLDPSRTARLGRRWPSESTDRAAIVAHMRARARADGLL
ncbi:MAG: hypothetical protein B7733_10270 [Myxococcales bacterium FL481]|nr:MAG: hypothetical protein B7733_10270 [Myxococcales bacterium FL481]